MTLSELVANLKPLRNNEEERRISRKIQNWVTDGIVLPTRDKSSGRGVHRKYDKHESYKIAVLLEATRFRLPGVVLQLIGTMFDDARPESDTFKLKLDTRVKSSSKNRFIKSLRQMLKNARSNKPAYMLLAPSETDEIIGVNLVSDEKFISTQSSAIVLNLTCILNDLLKTND